MDLEAAKKFIYTNARPLDLARWQYVFENGSQESVLRFLSAYQNEDGGFGHGLEPDCLNPNSAPLQTWVATQIIKEVDLADASHPMIQGILRYLESTPEFDGHTWANPIPSNNDYPHAPWWSYESPVQTTYNPTASLTGFILKFAEKGTKIYTTAIQLAKEAYAYFQRGFPLDSMHTVFCFVDLYDYLCECDKPGFIDLTEFRQLLSMQMKQILTYDTSIWSTEYVCKPSLYITSKSSAFYPDHCALCAFERDFISETQNADGTWNITWDWGCDSEQWAVSKNWWKSDLIIKNIRFYQQMQD